MTFWGYYKEIVKLGLPILVGQLGMIAVGFADNIMVGNYSTDALASASFVNNVFNIALMLCLGFTYGLTPLVGALYASKRQEDIGATLRRGLRINVIFALAVTAAMFILYLNVGRLGQPDELLPLIRPYYLIYLAGIVPVAVFNVFAQWSYALRGTTMPMVIIMTANCVNVAGNYLLISGHCGAPELGLTGAGLSTLFARLICPVAIIAVFALRKGWSGYRRGFLGRGGRSVGSARIIKTSLPVGMQMAMETASFSVACVMAGWLGKNELGAFQILLIVGTLGFCIYYSMGTSVSVLVANAAGKNDRALMRRIGWAGYMVILSFAALSSIVFVIFGHGLIGLFSDDEAVTALAIAQILPLVLYQLGDATQITFANALRGTSHVMPMLWIAFLSYIVVGIPVTYLLGFSTGMGLYGIYLSFSVSLFLAGALFMYFFLKNSRSKFIAQTQNGVNHPAL